MSKVSLLDRLQDICPLPLDESDSLPGKAIDKDSMKRKMLDGHMQGYYTDLSFWNIALLETMVPLDLKQVCKFTSKNNF